MLLDIEMVAFKKIIPNATRPPDLSLLDERELLHL
jgi:hypothetical protein